MALASYSELVTEVENYLNRTDYTPRIPTFIALTEARLNRLLEDPDMEVRATATGTGQYTALPNDFKRMIGVTTGNLYSLEQVSIAQITSLDQTLTGIPRKFAIEGGAITFAPINNAAPIAMIYVRRIPGLSVANPTNWLLTRSPDIYLFGVLLQAHMFGWDDERVTGIKAMFDEAIGELRIEGANRRLGASPIAPRLGRT